MTAVPNIQSKHLFLFYKNNFKENKQSFNVFQSKIRKLRVFVVENLNYLVGVEREEMEEKEEEDMAKDRVITIDIPNLAEQPRSIGENFR